MAESNDSVSVDMEKIYLGGKVQSLTIFFIIFFMGLGLKVEFFSFLKMGFMFFSCSFNWVFENN
jgi:hypothetical protein